MYTRKNAVYNAEKMAGLPIAVQIIGRAWDDEKILEIMDLTDKALGPRGFGPGIWGANKKPE